MEAGDCGIIPGQPEKRTGLLQGREGGKKLHLRRRKFRQQPSPKTIKERVPAYQHTNITGLQGAVHCLQRRVQRRDCVVWDIKVGSKLPESLRANDGSTAGKQLPLFCCQTPAANPYDQQFIHG